MEIGQKGNYLAVCREGKATLEVCFEKWEEIVQRNNKEAGSNEYSSFLDDLKHLNSMLHEFNIVRAMLFKLCYVVDNSLIKELQDKGYNIDTTNSTTYADTIALALQRSRSITSRIKSKVKKLSKLTKKDGETVEHQSYESVVTALNMSLGFPVNSETLTLAEFNSYQKHLTEKLRLVNERRHGRNKQE